MAVPKEQTQNDMVKIPKYRLVKKTTVSGFVMWIIQRKFLLWWEFVDCYTDESVARISLRRLREGVPAEKREVVT